ncbi:protein lin-37 homolog isoform X2 [Procambarus clarkii]|uniref:protein lin-37 homolog isoform X2 n=1 Tax=Procambarus clarkii TaxID=6728 RepID=UPI001E6702DE|nr:protein lin-37 homolog isoform X2 [Procambarus clarkii]
MTSSGIRIKLEREEPSVDVDAARGRFDAALQGLLQKDEESDSENESDNDNKTKVFTKIGLTNARSSRPPRKRRRKEIDLRDSGFHHTFVMRMFDRSVDLAQFDETSPLYPICRAWMINQPHNSSLNVKQEPSSPSTEMFNSTEGSHDGDFATEILSDGPPNTALGNKMPPPEPWATDMLQRDPRIPEPIPHPPNKLNEINECENTPTGLLLTEHLKRWRQIRNLWRNAAKSNDQRYQGSYNILKAMFDRAHEG